MRYNEAPFSAAPQSRSRTPLILGVFGGVLAVMGLFCCGGAVLLVKFGMDAISIEIQDELAAKPEIRQNIGDIESFSVNYTRTGSEDDEDAFVYDIQGAEGSGFVTVKQITLEDGRESIVSAELTMSDGRKIPIDVSSDE